MRPLRPRSPGHRVTGWRSPGYGGQPNDKRSPPLYHRQGRRGNFAIFRRYTGSKAKVTGSLAPCSNTFLEEDVQEEVFFLILLSCPPPKIVESRSPILPPEETVVFLLLPASLEVWSESVAKKRKCKGFPIRLTGTNAWSLPGRLSQRKRISCAIVDRFGQVRLPWRAMAVVVESWHQSWSRSSRTIRGAPCSLRSRAG